MDIYNPYNEWERAGAKRSWLFRHSDKLVVISLLLTSLVTSLSFAIKNQLVAEELTTYKQLLASQEEATDAMIGKCFSVWVMDESSDAQLRQTGIIQLKIK